MGSTGELEEFLRLPWHIYQDDPYWVPPLLSLERRLLDPRRGPFFKIGAAQYFLAFLDGRPAGRISAHINRRYDAYRDRETGFFGFFECLPHHQVAEALLEAARDWLRTRGRTRLAGPLNFTIYDEMGLLVEGFDSIPAIFQTHNPPYYEELLTRLGLHKAQDWYALRATDRDLDLAALRSLLERIMAGKPFRFVSFGYRDLYRRAMEICELFNEAWSRHWGHVPVDPAQFQKYFREIKPLVRRELVNLLVDDDDRLAAFSIGVPDLNPLIQQFNGHLTLWRRLRLYYEARFKPVRRARGLVLGVRQAHQGQRLHLAMLIRTCLHLLEQTPVEAVDISLVPENMGPWLKALESFGPRRCKTFRVLEGEV